MFNLFGGKKIPSDLSKIRTEHIPLLFKRDGDVGAFETLKRAATAGSIDCAVFVSSLLATSLIKVSPEKALGASSQYVYFTELAATRGDNTSRCNLAHAYFQQVKIVDGQMDGESYEFLKKAESWYLLAAGERFDLALKKLETLGGVFKWAHGAFAGTESKEAPPEKPPLLKDFIAQYGWDEAVTACAKAVVARIPNKAAALQFMLEELDGASRGNEHSKAAALRSGFSPDEYKGALLRSTPEVDGPDGPQQLILSLSLQLADDRVMMARFRCEAGREIQEHFKLGCFAYRENEID